MKRLVLDVTTLINWKSPHVVGIVRVQLELARALLAKNDLEYTVFAQFSSVNNQFETVPRKDVEDAIGSFNAYVPVTTQFEEKTSIPRDRFPVYSFRANGKTYIKRILFFLLPKKCHRLLEKIIEIYRNQGLMILLMRIAHRFLGRNILKYINAKTNKPIDIFSVLSTKNFKSSLFLSKNDCLISSGLDWDIGNHEYILHQKKNIGFCWVGICYDLIALKKPEYVQSTAFVQIFFKHYYFFNHGCDKIACISDFAKSQFQEESLKHHIQSTPILKTIHLGAALVAVNNHNNSIGVQNIIEKRKISKPYLLYVSTIEARKNHDILLEVWSYANEKGIVLPDIIFVGMIGWGIASFLERYKTNKSVHNKVHFLQNLTDKQLDGLYKNCLFTVFPSYMEGWGLAAAESLLYGKVCVISTAAALIEATQGLMPAIAPDDRDGWLAMICNLTYDIAAREKLEKDISTYFRPRSWDEFSQEFFNFCLSA